MAKVREPNSNLILHDDDPSIHVQPDLEANFTSIGALIPNAIATSQAYTDAQLGLRALKDPVRVVATTNVNISNPGTAVFDTVTLVSGDPILLAGQTAAAQNGPYVFNGSSSAMTRRADADTSVEMKPGLLIAVQEGSLSNRDKLWELQTDAPIVLGTTALTFALASGDTSGLANKLIFTGLKTASYAAAANEFTTYDTTSVVPVHTLPTAPPNGTRGGAKIVVQPGNNGLTVAAGGSDVFNKPGGSTTLSLSALNQGVSLEYNSGVWYVVANDVPLAALGSASNPVTSASATRPTLPVVWWVCTTQPTNWVSGDMWINNS